MARYSAKSRRRSAIGDETPRRPTTLSLVKNILQALLVDGAFLLAGAIAVAIYLYQADLRNDPAVILIFAGIVLIALGRGCAAWQEELNNYQRDLLLHHRKQTGGQVESIPGYFGANRDRY
jgi:uncharacterized membrane protein